MKSQMHIHFPELEILVSLQSSNKLLLLLLLLFLLVVERDQGLTMLKVACTQRKTSPPPLKLQSKSGWSNPGSTGDGPSWESADGKWFYGSSELYDGYMHVREAV